MALNAIGIDNFLAWVCQLAGLWGRGDKQRWGTAQCVCVCAEDTELQSSHDTPSTPKATLACIGHVFLGSLAGRDNSEFSLNRRKKNCRLFLLVAFPFFPQNPWFILIFIHVVLLKYRLRSCNSDWGVIVFFLDRTQHPPFLELNLTNFSVCQAEGAARISLRFTYWGNWGMRRWSLFFFPVLCQEES